MDMFPRIRVERAMLLLPAIASATPARVRAAVLRTWWNGWVTKRRFQQRSRGCIFGCDYPDSIEHYAYCPVVAEFGSRFLGLGRAEDPVADFMVLSPRYTSADQAVLVRKAVRVAAVYKLHCSVRHRPSGAAATLRPETLFQTAREIARGHAKVCQILDCAFSR